MKIKSARLVYMNPGIGHMFTPGNKPIPDDESANRWPVLGILNDDYSFHHQNGGVVDYNPLIGQTFQTALIWIKCQWKARRYGWTDRYVTWDGALKLNGQPWTPSAEDLAAEDWMLGGNSETGGGDPGDAPAILGIQVNGHTFHRDEGFPTVTFAGAKFTMLVPAGCTITGDSHVSITGTEVRILTPGRFRLDIQDAHGRKAEYHVFPSKWMKPSAGSVPASGDVADAFSRGGRLPTAAELTNAVAEGHTPVRSVGSLWGEWGDFSHYGAAPQPTFTTSSRATASARWGVNLTTGALSQIPDNSQNNYWVFAVQETM